MENMLLEKQYHIPYALFKKAFTAFQKKFVYPKTYLLMGILICIACIYGFQILFTDAQDKQVSGIVICICLVLCAVQWYNPKKIRRNLLTAVREIEDDQYKLTIYPDYLEIGTVLPPVSDTVSQQDDLFADKPEDNFSGTRIYYNKGLYLTEYDDFFMLYQTKVMFYVIPKSAFSQEELEIMNVHFSKKLDMKHFRSL